MAKRLTATEKWNDPWFCSLTNDEKLLWIYLTENCNHAGIWDVNWRLLAFHLGDIKWDEVKFAGRIVKIADRAKWFLPKFVAFQYGDLNPTNRAHQSVITILKKEGLWPLSPSSKEEKEAPAKGLASPFQGAKDKDKDMDMDKDISRARARNSTEPTNREEDRRKEDCEWCGPVEAGRHKKCHGCFRVYREGENDDNHRCHR